MMSTTFEKQVLVTLTSLNDTFPEKYLVIKQGVPCKIGRKVSSKTQPDSGNGYFDAKVLSRTHGEITLDKNTVWIQDLQSSNGTFINGERLSEEGKLSGLHPLKTGDILDFGVDIKDDEGKILYTKVSATVIIESQSPAPQPKATTTSSNGVVKAQNAEDILSMLQSEKTLSLEAADALEKIKNTFEQMDKNITTMKKRPEQSVLSNADTAALSKSISEINDRLHLFQRYIDQQRLDIDSNLAASTLHQDSVKKASSVCDQRSKETTENLADLAERVSSFENILETRLAESIAVVNIRIDGIEKSVQSISQILASSDSELSKIHSLFAEFGRDIKSTTKSIQERFQNEISLLSAKMGRFEKALAQKPAPHSTKDDAKSDGPSFLTVFFVVFLAGVTSALVWYTPFRT